MIDRKVFYDAVRKSLFGGKLNATQVAGIDCILNEYESKYSHIGLNALAYVFATAYHEVDSTMKPIEEYSHRKNMDYGRFFIDKNKRKYGLKMGGGPGKRIAYYSPEQLYFGRGLVQLTWYENYEKASKKLGVDFLNNPSFALQVENATNIMFLGMMEGWFTGRKLSNYFAENKTNFVSARAIINGKDKANMIADYARKFRMALS